MRAVDPSIEPLVYVALIVAAINVLVFVTVLARDVRTTEDYVNQPSMQDDVSSIPYDVVKIPSVLTDEECDALVKYAERHELGDSMVWDDSKSDSPDAVSAHRTSQQTWIRYDDEQVGKLARKLRNKAAHFTGVYDASSFEQVQLARYTPGQQYKQHYDACTERCPKHKLCRIATLLVYLTDNFDGGETEFPKRGVSIKPKKGTGVLFYDVDIRDESYPELEFSLHAGTPVTGGGPKWIANVWVMCPSK